MADALRDAGQRFVQRALQALESPAPPERAVHEARKDLKRARAVLRLIRPALSDRLYRRENHLLRQAAHAFNDVRDATVLADRLESLVRGHPELERDGQVVQLGRTLRAELARQRLRAATQRLARVRCILRQVSGRAPRWPLRDDGWQMLGPALRRIYKKGRRASPRPRPQPTSTALHAWRKQAKYLRYALEMMAPIGRRKLARLSTGAKRLTETLGDARDLLLLVRRVRAFRKRARSGLRQVLRICEHRRRRLERKAMGCGEEVYRLKPRAWEAQIKECWSRWRPAV